jgi:hypothetical protein
MSTDYMDQLPSEALIRYKKKLAICCLDDCPYRLPANVWENDPTEWPDVQFGDIYMYLIETPGNEYDHNSQINQYILLFLNISCFIEISFHQITECNVNMI